MPRLLYITKVYDQALDSLYAHHEGLEQQPFDEQHRRYIHFSFGWSDAIATTLEATGEWEVRDVLLNATTMNRMWASERGLHPGIADQPESLIGEHVRAFSPDVLFIALPLEKGFVRELKSAHPGIRLVTGWDGIGTRDAASFDGYDFMLSNAPNIAEAYRSQGMEAGVMAHGFAPAVHERLKEWRFPHGDAASPFSFVGSILRLRGFHETRWKALCQIARRLPLSIWSGSLPMQRPWSSRPQIKRLLKLRLRDYHEHGLLTGCLRGAVYGLDMFHVLGASRLTFNSHLDGTGPDACNIRLFEATGMGAVLLTDWKQNLHEFFREDEEVVTYRTTEEALDKARYLLDHPAECEKIARAGQRRTLRDHTLRQRFMQFHEIILQRLHQAS